MSRQTPATGRAAKLAALQAQQARAERRRRLLWGGAIGVTVMALIAVIGWALTRSGDTTAASATATRTFPNLSRDHIPTTTAPGVLPPAGGAHASRWQNCGVYSTPIVNENAVHSLEHGAFWITYVPDLPNSDIQALEGLVANQRYGLLSPYPNQSSPIVVTSWGVQKTATSASDPSIKDFIADYGDGSKAPEPQGECTGGVGTPGT